MLLRSLSDLDDSYCWSMNYVELMLYDQVCGWTLASVRVWPHRNQFHAFCVSAQLEQAVGKVLTAKDFEEYMLVRTS